MSRYRGPRVKITNRLRAFLPGLIDKKYKIKERKKYFRYKKIPKQYNNCLIEKQKLRFHYGLTERQLVRYIRIAGKSKGSTGQVLLQLLEMRLDNILFRLSMAWTIREARQLVNHRHILVNGCIVDIPSYRCKPGDIIATKDNQKSKDLIRRCIGLTRQRKKRLLPKHLSINSREYKAKVKKIIDRTEVYLKIDEFLVVQYYSRQI